MFQYEFHYASKRSFSKRKKNHDFRPSEVAFSGHFTTFKFQNKTSIQIELAVKNVFALNSLDNEQLCLVHLPRQIVILFSVVYV
jgi:hypothetical protein